MSRPNIVLIDAHDVGTWLGCYDKPFVSSPNIDRLAREGVRFENNIAVCPICGPSRLGFATGLLPHSLDVYGNPSYEPRGVCTPLARVLAGGGYCTMLFGSWKTNGDATWAGYEHSFPEVPPPSGAERPDSHAAERLVESRDSLRAPFADALEGAKPLFAHFSFQRCHRPFGQTYDDEVAGRLVVPESLPDTPTVRRDLASLCRSVSELDSQVGTVLDAIEDAGRSHDTVVVFLTDHGPALARHKHTLYEGGIRAALIVKHPDCRQSETVTHSVSNLDLYPTILEIAGLTVPAGPHAAQAGVGRNGGRPPGNSPSARQAPRELLAGSLHARSFLPLLLGERYTPRTATVSSFTYGQRSGMQYYTPMRCLRTSRYKLIHNYTELPRYLDTDWLARFALDRESIEDWPLFSEPVPALELYDLADDPWERRNLAEDRENHARARQMDEALEALLRATGDEILSGSVESKKESPVVQQWVRPEHANTHALH